MIINQRPKLHLPLALLAAKPAAAPAPFPTGRPAFALRAMVAAMVD